MNELETRKQLLLAESEVNRVLIARHWERMTEGALGLAGEARRAGKLAALGGGLLGALGLFRLARAPKARAGRPWFRLVFSLARWAVPLWMELRKEPR